MSTRFVGTTLTRLHLSEPFAPDDFTGTLRDAVEANVFTDYLSPTAKGVRSGFGHPAEPLTVPVDVSDTTRWISTPYVILAWRCDDKKVPAKRLKARCSEMEAAWIAANAVPRVPRTVKADIKENAELEMLPRCMASSKVVTIVWNTAEHWLLVSTQSPAQVDAVRKILHRAFGITATPTPPDDGLDADTLARLVETRPLLVNPDDDGWLDGRHGQD